MKRRNLLTALAVAMVALIFASASDVLAQSRNRNVTIYNNSRFQTIVSIHAYPSRGGGDAQVSDPDLIPGYTIPPGGSTVLPNVNNQTGDCVYNFRLTTNDPSRPDWFKHNVNVCGGSTISVAD